MRSKVLLGLLAIDGRVHGSMLALILELVKDDRFRTDILFITRSPVDSARNYIVEAALKEDVDWLLMMDDDTVCQKNPLDLIDEKKDIMLFPTPMFRNDRLRMNIYTKNTPKGCTEVIRGGTGTILLSKKALQKIPKPLFRFTYDERGQMTKSEDIVFCDQAKKAGFKIYMHSEYRCHHYKEVDLLSLVPDEK